jgi:hypothetical protein
MCDRVALARAVAARAKPRFTEVKRECRSRVPFRTDTRGVPVAPDARVGRGLMVGKRVQFDDETW